MSYVSILKSFKVLVKWIGVGYPASHWWIFLALAILPTFFGHSIFNWALKWVSTSTISMILLFEPIGSSILAYMILGERLIVSQWIGGGIVLLGLFFFTISTPQVDKNL